METLLSLLCDNARNAGGSHIVLIDDDGTETVQTASSLVAHADVTADMLASRGVRRGDRVLMALLPADFLPVFYAIHRLGAIPCPLALPAGIGAAGIFLERLQAATDLLDARHLVTMDIVADMLGDTVHGLSVVRGSAIADWPQPASLALIDEVAATPSAPGCIALIQKTSGSTGAQKGVMLTHANLAANTRGIACALEFDSEDVVVTWLPLNHDMGLIGTVLVPLHAGIKTVIMSPSVFQRHPVRWLQTISRHRGTVSPAPNFAYGYVTAKATDEEISALDLSSWRNALCGSEPIQVSTLQSFMDRFAPAGLRETAARPCYGLAEASLAVTFTAQRSVCGFDRIDRRALAEDHEVIDMPVDAGTDGALDVMNCGLPVADTEIRIVNDEGAPVPSGRSGYILVRGPSVMKGYWSDVQATESSVDSNGWLHTGDLGYMRDDGLRITGRAKDIIILRGVNHLPTDFEWAAYEVDGVRPGAAAAFGLVDVNGSSEELHIAVEADSDMASSEALRQAVATVVARKTGIRPAIVHVLARNEIPKTSSGKVRRSAIRDKIALEQRHSITEANTHR